jgi:hypothetical protein
MSRLGIAAASMPIAPVRHAVSPPTVGAYTGPSIATTAGLLMHSSAKARSESALG